MIDSRITARRRGEGGCANASPYETLQGGGGGDGAGGGVLQPAPCVGGEAQLKAEQGAAVFHEAPCGALFFGYCVGSGLAAKFSTDLEESYKN